MQDCRIIPILPYQKSVSHYLWCRQCGYQFNEQLPVTMRVEQVVCRGCETEGFLVGQTKRSTK